jgi:hypothetical protein
MLGPYGGQSFPLSSGLLRLCYPACATPRTVFLNTLAPCSPLYELLALRAGVFGRLALCQGASRWLSIVSDLLEHRELRHC